MYLCPIETATIWHTKVLSAEKKKCAEAGNWRSIGRTPIFYTWAGNTFELLCIEHLPMMRDKRVLRLSAATIAGEGLPPTEELRK